MGHKYLIIGTGEMGRAIGYDLLKFGAAQVTLFDRNFGQANEAHRLLKFDPRLQVAAGDAADVEVTAFLMRQHDVAVGAADYSVNLALTRAAIEADIHFCDLGGNNDIVAAQFALDSVAVAKGIKIIPDTGIAPGSAGIVVMLGIGDFLRDFGEHPDYALILCGGLPQDKVGPLDYARVFSVKGLLNECLMPTEILRDGEVCRVESMTDLEPHDFPVPFGRLWAAYTSGGSSTLTQTLKGKLKDISYKTLRYPGHWEKMVTLKGLGFFGEAPIQLGSQLVTPRTVSEALFERNLPSGAKDALILRVIVGKYGGAEYTYDLIDFYDEATGHSAMQRTTGYSASIIAQMMAEGVVTETGVLHQELVVPPRHFTQEWAKRGIILTASVTRHG